MSDGELDQLVTEPWREVAHGGDIRLDRSGSRVELPLGPLHRAHKIYVYLDADAYLVVNGRELKMLAGPDGYWEALMHTAVMSMEIWTDRICAHGRYRVVGYPQQGAR